MTTAGSVTSTAMNKKEFQKYLDRDGGCYHCGETEAVSPQHRANRGMGGSKKRDVPSNILVFCSKLNFLVEADPYWADMAYTYGWKLNTWEDPLQIAVYDAQTALWWILDNQYTRTVKTARKG